MFTSVWFIVSFVAFCGVYFSLRQYQRPLLLVAGIAVCVFAGKTAAATIVFVSLAGFLCGQKLQESPKPGVLLWAIGLTISPLVLFKYQHLGSLLAALGLPGFDQGLPVGVSFYTFSILGYLVDLYIGRISKGLAFVDFLVFVSFFPKLVSGPVERAAKFGPQIADGKEFDYGRVVDGLKIIGWGYFLKIVVADRLAPIVDHAFENPAAFSGIPLALICVLYMFQIYYDFRGYSDIAVGTAKILGYDLTWNFNRPYAARSVSDYWRRWHISLMSWFFDYIFIPLSGLLRSWRGAGTVVALLATFLVSAIWHGTGLTFLLFGLAHACALSAEFLTTKLRRRVRDFLPKRAYGALAWIMTFVFLAFVDVLFRAHTVADAAVIWKNVVTGILPDLAFLAEHGFRLAAFKTLIAGLPVVKVELLIAVLGIAAIEAVDFLGKQEPVRHALTRLPAYVRWASYYAVGASIVFLGAFNSVTTFVYVRF
ncbi:MAG: MBOAT family O-acyltransferase [Ignavibacteria bacterium]